MPFADQGINPKRYKLIPRTLVFLTRGESVLLIKYAANKRGWAGKYNGLGGHVERGEAILSAAKRELEEESGLEANQLRLCGTVTIDTGPELGIGIYVFRGKCDAGEPISSQEGTPEWVRFTEVENYPLLEDLYILLPRVLSFKPGDVPFSAHMTFGDDGSPLLHFAE